MNIETLILKLEEIAGKNGDSFRYGIGVEVTRRGISYSFVCSEKADGHEFLTGSGSSVFEAVEDAMKDLPQALKSWGYKE